MCRYLHGLNGVTGFESLTALLYRRNWFASGRATYRYSCRRLESEYAENWYCHGVGRRESRH